MKKWTSCITLLLLGVSIYSCRDDSKALAQRREKRAHFISAQAALALASKRLLKRGGHALQGSSATAKRSVKEVLPIVDEGGKTAFYAVNYQGGGFVLLAADNRVEPILGFSDERAFTADPKQRPPTLSAWISAIQEKVEDIRSREIPQSPSMARAWARVDRSGYLPEGASADERRPIQLYGPPHLLHSSWEQGCGYNAQLPQLALCGDKHCGRGLVSTLNLAMAQVMKYYAYPKTYNWSAMADDHSTTETARLIGDVHSALDRRHTVHLDCDYTWIDFGKGMDVPQIFEDYFGYSSAEQFNTTAEQQDKIMWIAIREIQAGRPVILLEPDYGNVVVWDGHVEVYSDLSKPPKDYFHANFCQGGVGDGWYLFDDVTLSDLTRVELVYELRP